MPTDGCDTWERCQWPHDKILKHTWPWTIQNSDSVSYSAWVLYTPKIDHICSLQKITKINLLTYIIMSWTSECSSYSLPYWVLWNTFFWACSVDFKSAREKYYMLFIFCMCVVSWVWQDNDKWTERLIRHRRSEASSTLIISFGCINLGTSLPRVEKASKQSTNNPLSILVPEFWMQQVNFHLNKILRSMSIDASFFLVPVLPWCHIILSASFPELNVLKTHAESTTLTLRTNMKPELSVQAPAELKK